jgi:sec-independent protein translocase protein TatA
MSGLTGSAPAFLGKPSALSAGIASAGGARGAGSRSVATMGLFGLGLPELVVIGGVAALLFGPSKLPELGKSLGKTVKSFQAAANVRHPRPSLPSRKRGIRDPHNPTRETRPARGFLPLCFFEAPFSTRTRSDPRSRSRRRTQEFQDELKEGKEAEDAKEIKQIEDGEDKKAE